MLYIYKKPESLPPQSLSVPSLRTTYVLNASSAALDSSSLVDECTLVGGEDEYLIEGTHGGVEGSHSISCVVSGVHCWKASHDDIRSTCPIANASKAAFPLSASYSTYKFEYVLSLT